MNTIPPLAGDLPPPRATLLQARSVVGLVDDGFAALRVSPSLMLGTGALFLVPVIVAVALIGDGDPTPGLITSGSWVAGIVSVLGFSLAPALMGLPLARAVAFRAAGVVPTWRACYRVAGRTWLAVVVAWLVLLPVRLIALALAGIPLVVVTALTIPLSAVLALEGTGIRAGLRRTVQLGVRGFGRGLSLVLVQVLVGVVVSAALLTMPLATVAGLSDTWQRAAANLAELVVGLLLFPSAAWTAAAFYLDERVRRDALDLHTALLEWDGLQPGRAGWPAPMTAALAGPDGAAGGVQGGFPVGTAR